MVVSVLFKELGLLVMSARLPVSSCATKHCFGRVGILEFSEQFLLVLLRLL